MNEQPTGRDPENSIDFRQDAGPAEKEQDKPKIMKIYISFDKVAKAFRWLKEKFK